MTVLPIPASLTNTTYTAPAGTYTAPTAKTACHGVVTVDLSAATITDQAGGLPGVGILTAAVDCTALNFIGGTITPTVRWTGSVIGGMTGPTVLTINGLATTACDTILSQKASPVTTAKVIGRNMNCQGLGIGLELLGTIDVDNCILTGGSPNQTSPMGLHFAQDAAKTILWSPGTYLRATNSTITGFVSSATTGFRQGDSCLPESACESVFIDNCILGHNTDSGGLDSKACWAQISNCIIHSDGGRAISGHTMGDGRGPWNGVRSFSNTIYVYNQFAADGTTRTEAYQAEGILEAFSDTVNLIGTNSRLAVTSFQDSGTGGSGAPGSYPRLGTIKLHNVRSASGSLLTGPVVNGSDATHPTTITSDTSGAGTITLTLPSSVEFDSGPNGVDIDSTTQAELSNVSGQNAKYSNVSPVSGPYCYLIDTTPLATTSFERVDFNPTLATLWLVFYIRLLALPATSVFIMSWNNGANKIGDLRLNADGTLTLRDLNTAVINSVGSPLNVSATQWDRVAIKIQPGVAGTGHQMRMYLGSNRHGTTPDFNGIGNATAGGQASVDNVRWGVQAAAAVKYSLDRLKFAATEVAGIAAGVTANAGPDQSNVAGTSTQLVGSASGGTGPYTYTWRFISGPVTPALSSTSVASPSVTGMTGVGTYVFGLITHDAIGGNSTEDTVSVTTIAPTGDFLFLQGGIWKQASWQTLKAGAWS